MTFTVPTSVAERYTSYMEKLFLDKFEAHVRNANENLAFILASDGTDNQKQLAAHRLMNGVPWSFYSIDRVDSYSLLPSSFTLKPEAVLKAGREQAEAHLALLTERVNGQLAPDEIVIRCCLGVDSENLLSGSIYTDTDARIDAVHKTNYRYGEHSSNGVLTVYSQFPVTRHGTPLPGASITAAAKAAAKAERDQERAYRAAAKLAEKRARLAKGIAREAKRLRKYADEVANWPPQTDSHREHMVSLLAEYRQIADLVEAFDLDSMIPNRAGTETPALVYFSSAGGITDYVGRQVRKALS